MSEQQLDENQLITQRREKLARLREAGNPYPNDFRCSSDLGAVRAAYGEKSKEWLAENPVEVSVAGRLMAKRIMGKASFIQVQSADGQLQFFVQRDAVGEAHYADFKTFDIGDIVGATGELFVTKTGELSLKVSELRLLTKSLRPLPGTYQGMADQETRYRQRYVDLIINEKTRNTFRLRAAMIRYVRDFFDQRGYLEIESPMMQAIPGGASAKPFVTHHNALDIDLYLRVAQELAVKRCLVGGFDKVYEMNRVFRNEGLSTRHNPEFTMIEYNEAYADHVAYMDLTEALLRGMAEQVLGSAMVSYQGQTIDFAKPFARISMTQAVLDHNPELSEAALADPEQALAYARAQGLKLDDGTSQGLILFELFDATVESKLIDPTFITDHPIEVSPLSRRSEHNPALTDRFELFIGGRELANGFSELNDADDQAQRFSDQVAQKDAGDDEAMYFDHDYIRALEYGLPPNAGGGIGIDRLVMLFADEASIRDVILFPHMRPEAES